MPTGCVRRCRCQFIDTIMLATATTMRVADEELADGEITPAMHAKLAARLAADAVPYNGTQQLEWLTTTLAASTADWLFVVGHFPVYSGGHHGNTPELVEVCWRWRRGHCTTSVSCAPPLTLSLRVVGCTASDAAA